MTRGRLEDEAMCKNTMAEDLEAEEGCGLWMVL